MDRRRFIRNSALTAASALLPGPLAALAAERPGTVLTILHTNDVHSRIDPFPDNHRHYPGQGGAAARAAIISGIRKEAGHVLLLDAGDILQGTPYFNFFNGELEIRLMNEMGYDAATIGNHDFDAGIDTLAHLAGEAAFPLINCNYDFSNTPMAGKTIPYRVFKKGKLRIGVTGVGIKLDGLVPRRLFRNTVYNDPVAAVNRQARHLKYEEKCDYVILLSHLGYSYNTDKISDVALAGRTEHVDLIIGGHTHTFLDQPVERENSAGEKVLIAQVGWAGVQLGRLDVFFHEKNRKNQVFGQTVIVDKKSIAI